MSKTANDANINRERFDAVLFDMDGVLTRTATVHARAWHRLFDEYLERRKARGLSAFDPFEYPDDYFKHLDGRPRYDGVETFLDARGIQMERGAPDDPPTAETVCGLGNRKNELVQTMLEEGVEVFDDAVACLREWKGQGYKTAIVSSSKNCKPILEITGLGGLFDTRVDGTVAEQRGLKGKPHPDTFLLAAEQLGVEPKRAVLIEDALSGVEAGRRGGFGLVIGLDRDGHNPQLAESADIVLQDLWDYAEPPGEVSGERGSGSILPAGACQEEILRKLDGRRVALFLDYDGTLTPIMGRPEQAILAPEMRETLRQLARVCPVAVVSGRDRADVKSLVGLDNLVYAGSHGFDITGPGGMEMQHEAGVEAVPEIESACKELSKRLSDVAGAQVESKKFAVAVHYRNVAKEQHAEVEKVVDEVHKRHGRLRKRGGKAIFELQPDVEWHKGKAVLHLLEALHLDGPDVLPIYIGDDLTDEDAFAALADRGLGVLVSDEERETSAHLLIGDTHEVQRLLRGITEIAAQGHEDQVWKLVYDRWDPNQQSLREALCTLGNGVWASRGAFEESRAGGPHYPGTYLGGGFNRLETIVSGRPIENEDLVNWPNWLCLSFRPKGGEWLDLDRVEVLHFRQELDVKRGVLTRRVRFCDPDGRVTTLVARRLVSMSDPHLAGIEWSLTPENWSGTVELRSALDGGVINAGVKRYRELNSRHLEFLESGRVGEDGIYLAARTNQSHIRMAQAARTNVYFDGHHLPVERRTVKDGPWIGHELTFEAKQRHAFRVEKIVTLFSSRDAAVSEPTGAATKWVERAPGFADLLAAHEKAWARLWRRCDIAVDDAAASQRILRVHIFHLLQTVSMNTIDRDVGIPARGLHGEAYRGHIFWDVLFIFPFLNLSIPELTRELIMYRFRRLPEARVAAREAGYEGAMFPWQSGSDGREESQIVHLNPRSGRWVPDETHLQRHVNAAVAYDAWRYYTATGDLEFLTFFGAELILDIARFWASACQYNAARDRYEIHGVVGPDEYHTRFPADAEKPGLNNNAYTNVMAAWVLQTAARVLESIGEERRRELCAKLDITDEDLHRWGEISHKMFVPFHADPDTGRRVISQFEGFETLQKFDWEGYRKRYGDIQRLDRILESEGDTPNRYQVSKQADSLMLFYLFPDRRLKELFDSLGYPFDPAEDVRANVDYCCARTSHGSTLSRIIHSWVMARTHPDQSWHLFEEALRSDVEDIQGGTTPEGVHLGAMAGTVDLVQRCYAGLRPVNDVLWIEPALPDRLKGIRMRVRFRGCWLALDIRRDGVRVTAERGLSDTVKIGHQDRTYTLREGDAKQFDATSG